MNSARTLNGTATRVDPSDQQQHRTRNVLSVMRSVFERTVENGTSLDSVAAHYRGRFDTLAAFLTGSGMDDDGTYDLETLVWNELLRFPAEAGGVVEVSGPPVRLPHDQAQPIALAIHELATNAVKFGALGPISRGRIDVQWVCDGADIVLTWRETGSAILMAAPARRGFGRTFIEEGLPYQIGAETGFAFGPGSVTGTFKFTIDQPRA